MESGSHGDDVVASHAAMAWFLDIGGGDSHRQATSVPTPEQLLSNASVAKAAGNADFGENRYHRAECNYTEAISLLDIMATVYRTGVVPKPIVLAATELEVVCLANRAQCYLKLGMPGEAVDDCCERLSRRRPRSPGSRLSPRLSPRVSPRLSPRTVDAHCTRPLQPGANAVDLPPAPGGHVTCHRPILMVGAPHLSSLPSGDPPAADRALAERFDDVLMVKLPLQKKLLTRKARAHRDLDDAESVVATIEIAEQLGFSGDEFADGLSALS